MHFKSSFLILSTIMLLLVTKGCHSQLMCYVCDHCTTVTAKTPLMTCDDSFFNGGATELPSTMITTESTITTTEEDPNTTMSTTASTTASTMTASSTTTETTSENPTTQTTTTPQTTEPQPPTPPTMAPVETTTALPTPPTQGTVMPIVEIVTQGAATAQNETAVANGTLRNYTNTAAFRQRKRRSAMAQEVTYHCYSVRLTANMTVNTLRGCSRVTTEQSVCQLLQDGVSNGTTVSKCQFCQTNRCNSSSTFGVSIVAMIIGLVVSLVKRS